MQDNTSNPTGLFRTPLSCALLTGALTVGIYEFFRLVIWPLPSGNYQLLLFIEFFLVSTMQLQGPVLCRRSRTMATRSSLMALVLALIVYASFVLLPWKWFTANVTTIQGITQGLVIRNAIGSLIHAMVLGVLLARLYGLKSLGRRCCFMAIIAVLPMIAFYNVRLLSGSVSVAPEPAKDTNEMAGMSQMLTYLSTVALVVLPTIPIDRALRRQQLRAAEQARS